MIFNIFPCFGLFSIIFGLSSTDYAQMNSRNDLPKIYIEDDSTMQSYDFTNNNHNHKNYHNLTDTEIKLNEKSIENEEKADDELNKKFEEIENNLNFLKNKTTRQFKIKRKKMKKHKNKIKSRKLHKKIDYLTTTLQNDLQQETIDFLINQQQQQQQQQQQEPIKRRNKSVGKKQQRRKRIQMTTTAATSNPQMETTNTNSMVNEENQKINNNDENFDEFQMQINENQNTKTTATATATAAATTKNNRKYVGKVDENGNGNGNFNSYEHKHRKKFNWKERKAKRKQIKAMKKMKRTRRKHERKRFENNNKFTDVELVKKIIEEKQQEQQSPEKALGSIDYFEWRTDKTVDFNGIKSLEISTETLTKPSKLNLELEKKNPEHFYGSSRRSFDDKSFEVFKNLEDSFIDENQDVIEKFKDNSIRNGDLSCFKDDFNPAPEIQHADVKYLRNENHSGNDADADDAIADDADDDDGESNSYLEVEYICHQGYKLVYNNENNINVYCKNGHWIGELPFCIKDIKDNHKKSNDNVILLNITTRTTIKSATCNYPERCDQLCFVEDNGIEKCSCHKGFKMKNNHCEDINECVESLSICEFDCQNTFGNYVCKCPKGLRKGDTKNCIDINECLLRNGHGPCQDTCINIWGSYKCSCDSLNGSQLGSDGHSCLDIDECTINNGNCSHTCINTMGRAYCVCPEGWTIDKDWKTCLDIDECAEESTDSSEQKCEFGCINTPGSFSCLVDFGADQPIYDELTECSDGFYRNSTTQDCQDINECLDNNGGCFHLCINTIGSFYCSCQQGYILIIDKRTCINNNSTGNISCPPLFPPKHGYLECSRPIASDINAAPANAAADDDDDDGDDDNGDNMDGGNDGNGGSIDKNGNEIGMVAHQQITNRLGSQCILRCPTGFRINGKFSKQCSNSGAWIGDDDGTCIRYPTPKLICPANIILETPPNETMAKLQIPKPKTDVNFENDITITPKWLRNTEVAIEVGSRNITYTAKHPISKLLISCTFVVTVLEGESPKVKFCPSTQTYSLDSQHESIEIKWKEPIFTDNVNITEITKTNISGSKFGVGSHQIIYVAKDNAGYISKCIFKVLVNVPTIKEIINHPLPIYRMFY